MTPVSSQRGAVPIFEVVLLALVLVLGGYAGYRYWSAHNAVDQPAQPVAHKPKLTPATSSTPDAYAGWKTYTWSIGKMSFRYPSNWYIREDVSVHRVYLSNNANAANVNITNAPAGFEQLWISTNSSEINGEEALLQSGKQQDPVDGPVTKSTIAAGKTTINVYQFATVGGPGMQAFWSDSKDVKFIATESTELNSSSQTAEVAMLKQVLPTVVAQ